MDSNVIFNQLGGYNKVNAMIGVRHPVKDEKKGMVAFRFMTGKPEGPVNEKKSVNAVRIYLNGKDLYDLEFMYLRGTTFADRGAVLDVDAENLKSVFEEYTGLRLSL